MIHRSVYSGHYTQVVLLYRWSFYTGGPSIQEVFLYRSFYTGGLSIQVILLYRWSFYTGGLFIQVFLYRWSFYAGGPSIQMVLLYRWSFYMLLHVFCMTGTVLYHYYCAHCSTTLSSIDSALPLLLYTLQHHSVLNRRVTQPRRSQDYSNEAKFKKRISNRLLS